jgi:hypothetical protein
MEAVNIGRSAWGLASEINALDLIKCYTYLVRHAFHKSSAFHVSAKEPHGEHNPVSQDRILLS